MREKRSFIITIVVSLSILIIVAFVNYIVDPYMHYRYNEGISYNLYLDNQRYQNDGISKNMKYNAVIVGTSMTENFKASQFNQLFSVESIKIPYSGGSYNEINQLLLTSLNSGNDIKYVLRSLDYNRLLKENDIGDSTFDYEYLYNDLIYDDYKYLVNKETLFFTVLDMLSNQKYIDFDNYSYWADGIVFSKEVVDLTYSRQKSNDTKKQFSNNDKKIVDMNIDPIIDICKKYQNIDFYLFLTPYSIYYFDELNQRGELERQLEAEKYAIEKLIQQNNIHLFSLFNETDIITDLDNYHDIAHYSPLINTYILEYIKDENNRITKNNYENYCNKESLFYWNYNYDDLFSD